LEDKINKNNLRYAAIYYAKFVFMMLGYEVLSPEYYVSYDLVVLINGKWNKVQIKTSTSKSKYGIFQFSLRRCRINNKGTRRKLYSSNECDYFMLIDLDLNIWLIPYNILKDYKSGINPIKHFSEYKIVLPE